MESEVRMAWDGSSLAILFGIAIIVGCLFQKKNRKIFIIPCLLISIIVLNPLTYSVWYKFNSLAYWRLLWIVPIVPMISAVPAQVVENERRKLGEVAGIVVSITVIIWCGSYVYGHGSTTFSRANNTEKLPDYVVEVGKILLENDDSPTVVSDPEISVYLRQYSGKIRSPYSRDAVYGSLGPGALKFYNALTTEDFKTLNDVMYADNYAYLVTKNEDLEKKQIIEDSGFAYIGQINQFGIYKILEREGVVRKYNNRHQLIEISTYDEKGDLVDNLEGYSTIQYNYDDNGCLSYEYYRNRQGIGVLDSEGKAGTIWEYNNKRKLITERYIGVNQEPVGTGSLGISCIRNEYTTSDQLYLTYYYDTNGELLHVGSANLHEYFCDLIDKKAQGYTIFMSIKDEGSRGLTSALMDDLNKLDVKCNLIDNPWTSFVAVISKEGTIDQISKDLIDVSGKVSNIEYRLISANYEAGNLSSIQIAGIDFSMNQRGLNIVIVKDGEVVESVVFDTDTKLMKENVKEIKNRY